MLVVACGLLLPAGAFAQSAVQSLPGVVNRPTPQVPLPPTPTPIPLPGATTAPEGVNNPTAPVPTLKQIDFTGVTVVPMGDLQAIASHYLNRNLTRGDIAQLKYEVAKRYYASGYILVRVVTPPQDLSSGVLHIVVYEAKIEMVTVPNNRLVSPYITGGIASELHKGEVFREDNVESMVRDMDDLRGVKASVDLSPGSQVGTTDLTVKLEKDHDFQQQVSVNNYGSKLTGQWLFNANLQYANLLGLGELYTLDVSHSNNSFFSIRPGFQTPTGLWNIWFDASYLYSTSDVNGQLAALSNTGRTDDANFGFSSALLNTASQKITVRGGFEARHAKSDFASTGTVQSDDELRQFNATGSYLLRLANTTAFASLEAVKGVDILGANDQGDANLSRAGNPEGFMLRPTVFVQQNLWPNGSVKGLVTGQYSPNTLLASDLFSLGGYGSVRGFQPAETTGESGIQYSVELDQTVFRQTDWSVLVGAWTDGGHVWNFLPGSVTDSSLYSAGLGAELDTDILKVGSTGVRFDWAHTLGNYNDPSVDSDTFYVQVLQNF
jgi:hemolysin activation/secretion protein